MEVNRNLRAREDARLLRAQGLDYTGKMKRESAGEGKTVSGIRHI
jgi:hypothetical protein